MKLQRPFLRSKVERQLFGLFLSCAVVPIFVLSVLSYQHVTQQLYEQSRTRMHRASKATGMLLLDRLVQVEADLDDMIAAAGRLRSGHRSLRHLRSVEVVAEGGERTAWLGEGIELPEISAAQREHLRGDKPLLLAVHRSGGEPRILLVKPLHTDGSGELVVAEIDREYLFEISGENTLPPMADFCVLGGDDRVLACSLDAPGFLSALTADRPVAGQFEWGHEGRKQLAYFWSVFLRPSHQTSQWTVVLSEPEDAVLAPIATFRMTFPAAVLLAVFVVILMCVNQIRRRLVPLKQLGDGARRIAERDFAVEVSVDSADEFQELADSFNAMARKLEEQFDSLATLIDIDRAILSAIERDKIVNTLIARLRELYPCDSIGVSLVVPEESAALRTQFSGESDSGSRVVDAAAFSAVEQRQLEANPESLLVDLGADAPSYLAPHVRTGMRQCLLLPLFVRGELAGVVSLGHRRAGAHDAKRGVYARQLADQTATALANALAIEENRVLAYYDRLTGLPNRLLFKERLAQGLAAARKHREQLATCVFDIDGFKRINDTFGHDVGDVVIKQVADRMSQVIPAAGLARLGGDQFGVLLTDLAAVDDAARVAKRILESISEPFPLPEQSAFLTASIGIALYPEDGLDVENLLRNADAAMYHAKDHGGDNFKFYARAMNATAFRRLQLENDLRRALDQRELRVFYQPIVDVETRQFVGAEALVRWEHPRMGLTPPSEFISMAEQTGIIVELGKWVLETACTQNRKWQEAGLPPISMAVNLSSRQLKGEVLLHTVRRALNSTGMRAQYLILELTESMLMDGDQETVQTLHGLKDAGVQLSIDDFGTGYSSLVYLKNFPIDHVKIDRTFLRDATRNTNDAALTKAIIAMAHSLDLQVVAEGVELDAQMAFLRENACDMAQGYLISDPIPPDTFAKLMHQYARE